MLRARTSMASTDSAMNNNNDMKDTSISFDAESGNMNKYMNNNNNSSTSSSYPMNTTSALPSWASNSSSSSRDIREPNIQVSNRINYSDNYNMIVIYRRYRFIIGFM